MTEQIEDFRQKFEERRPLFDRLGQSIVLSLTDLLAQENIATLDIASRTKSWDSAREKFSRKGYSDPFDEMEDLCGVRVICYYPSDIERIAEVIRGEFEVSFEENTASRLAPHEFGYRSTHLIACMQPDWLHVPAHRGLKGYKAEIQVRTVLMHAWAEIQHKLAYKSQDQVPDLFQRQLYRLSAKFEEADEQFDGLRHDLEQYRRQFAASTKEATLSEIPLNLDNLNEFLGIAYANRKPSRNDAAALLAEVKKLSLNFQDLFDYIEAQKRALKVIDKNRSEAWSQTGALRNALELSNDEYLLMRKAMVFPPAWYEMVKAGRKALGKTMPW